MGIHAATYMQFIYPSIVMVGGYCVMSWAIEQSHKNIGLNGEKLRKRNDLSHSNTAAQNAGLGRVLKRAEAKNLPLESAAK